ncbi:MAG: hypothetical protein AAF715_19480 [Myxococcota bacterium]
MTPLYEATATSSLEERVEALEKATRLTDAGEAAVSQAERILQLEADNLRLQRDADDAHMREQVYREQATAVAEVLRDMRAMVEDLRRQLADRRDSVREGIQRSNEAERKHDPTQWWLTAEPGDVCVNLQGDTFVVTRGWEGESLGVLYPLQHEDEHGQRHDVICEHDEATLRRWAPDGPARASVRATVEAEVLRAVRRVAPEGSS